MKTRKVTIELAIPAWVPTKRRLQQIGRGIKYKVFPFRCEVTGKRLTYKHPKYEYKHARRVMIDTLNRTLCREQWIKYIRNYFAANAGRVNTETSWLDISVEERTCDSCGHVRPTVSSLPDMIIGMQWWNGFHMCENCLTETVRLGAESTSTFEYINGRLWNINERGVLVAPRPQSDLPTTITMAPGAESRY